MRNARNFINFSGNKKRSERLCVQGKQPSSRRQHISGAGTHSVRFPTLLYKNGGRRGEGKANSGTREDVERPEKDSLIYQEEKKVQSVRRVPREGRLTANPGRGFDQAVCQQQGEAKTI